MSVLKCLICVLIYLNSVESQQKILYPFDIITGVHYEEITEHPHCMNFIKNVDKVNVEDSNPNQEDILPITDETTPPVFCITFLKSTLARNRRLPRAINKFREEKSVLLSRISRSTLQNDTIYDKDFFLQKPPSTNANNFNKWRKKRDVINRNWSIKKYDDTDGRIDKRHEKEHLIRGNFRQQQADLINSSYRRRINLERNKNQMNNVLKEVAIENDNRNTFESIPIESVPIESDPIESIPFMNKAEDSLQRNVPIHPFLRHIPEDLILRHKQVVSAERQQSGVKNEEEIVRQQANNYKLANLNHPKEVTANLEATDRNSKRKTIPRQKFSNVQRRVQQTNLHNIRASEEHLHDIVETSTQINVSNEKQVSDWVEEQRTLIQKQQQGHRLKILQAQQPALIHTKQPLHIKMQNKYVAHEMKKPEVATNRKQFNSLRVKSSGRIQPNRSQHNDDGNREILVEQPISQPNQRRKQTKIGDLIQGEYSYNDGTYLRKVHYEAGVDGYKIIKEELIPFDDLEVTERTGWKTSK